jgi:RNA polymerase sigma-70 factor (ECF subfamily)
MDDENLSDLIGRARAGDQVAIQRLLEQFEGDVRMTVRDRLPRALRSQFDSMDFVQAVWKSVFTGFEPDLTQFTTAQHLKGYLEGVARNKVIAEYRRRTRTRKYDLKREEPLYVQRGNRELVREVPASDPSPSQNVQARDRFAQMIVGRSPLEVEVIELRRSGLTFDEIAQKTGINERSVRRIIDSVRRKMEARRWQ